MSQEALLALWRQYHDNGDISARDRLVFSLAPIVKCIVYRKIREIPAYREVDDFISCGLEALIRSIDRYDPDKGATLEQFAWTRIHGAVLDELRRFDWAPRSLRRWSARYNRPVSGSPFCTGALPAARELSRAAGDHRGRSSPTLTDDIARSEIGSLNTLVVSEDDRPSERMDTLASN